MYTIIENVCRFRQIKITLISHILINPNLEKKVAANRKFLFIEKASYLKNKSNGRKYLLKYSAYKKTKYIFDFTNAFETIMKISDDFVIWYKATFAKVKNGIEQFKLWKLETFKKLEPIL